MWKTFRFYIVSTKRDARRFILLRAPMFVTYYIKLFRTGANRHNPILMSLLVVVAETINPSPVV